jgi:hypothetical protein
MSDVDRALSGFPVPSVSWSAVVAGTAVAAGTALVLHSFAGAIGLAVSSTAPTWRDASFALVFLSGLYLVLVALLAYGLGGYVAGRLRAPIAGMTLDETEFRDGVHGLLVWAIATLVTALVVALVALGATRLAAPSGGEAGPAASIAGENIIAFDLDRLFRSDPPVDGADLEYNRSEAARILLAAAGHSALAAQDRTHLIKLVTARTGLNAADAESRIDSVLDTAKQNVARARRAGVLLAFMTGAAAVLGSAIAWFAATAGGAHRGETAPTLWWSRPPSPRRS